LQSFRISSGRRGTRKGEKGDTMSKIDIYHREKEKNPIIKGERKKGKKGKKGIDALVVVVYARPEKGGMLLPMTYSSRV